MYSERFVTALDTLTSKAGCRVHTVTTGSSDKPLMLLLHGFPELWGMWEHQLRHFREDYNVAAIDMRGYGESSRPGVRNLCLALAILCLSHSYDKHKEQSGSCNIDVFLLCRIQETTTSIALSKMW